MVNTVSHPAPRQDTSTHTIYRAGASPARFHRRLGTMERGPRRLGSRPGMRKRERIGQNVWGGSMSGELISGSPAARADPVRSGWRGSRPGSPGVGVPPLLPPNTAPQPAPRQIRRRRSSSRVPLPALSAGRDNRGPSWQSRSHLQMTWGRFFGLAQKTPIAAYDRGFSFPPSAPPCQRLGKPHR